VVDQALAYRPFTLGNSRLVSRMGVGSTYPKILTIDAVKASDV
jgi:hypothetical protein